MGEIQVNNFEHVQVVVTWGIHNPLSIERHDLKYFLPATFFAVGKYVTDGKYGSSGPPYATTRIM